MMSQSHVTTDKAFKEQCFLLERGASVGADFNLFSRTRMKKA